MSLPVVPPHLHLLWCLVLTQTCVVQIAPSRVVTFGGMRGVGTTHTVTSDPTSYGPDFVASFVQFSRDNLHVSAHVERQRLQWCTGCETKNCPFAHDVEGFRPLTRGDLAHMYVSCAHPSFVLFLGLVSHSSLFHILSLFIFRVDGTVMTPARRVYGEKPRLVCVLRVRAVSGVCMCVCV